MKKECVKYQSMVEAFLAGKLSGFERQSFVEHVKTCRVCHEELEIYHVIYSVKDELEGGPAVENSNYMASLEQMLGNVGKNKAIRISMASAYGFVIAGVAAIAAGIALLFI